MAQPGGLARRGDEIVQTAFAVVAVIYGVVVSVFLGVQAQWFMWTFSPKLSLYRALLAALFSLCLVFHLLCYRRLFSALFLVGAQLRAAEVVHPSPTEARDMFDFSIACHVTHWAEIAFVTLALCQVVVVLQAIACCAAKPPGEACQQLMVITALAFAVVLGAGHCMFSFICRRVFS